MDKQDLIKDRRIITNHIKQAFNQVHRFFESYQPFLAEFWQNRGIDFEILKSDDLKNPAEVIEAPPDILR